MTMESYYDGREEREFRAQCERRKRMHHERQRRIRRRRRRRRITMRRNICYVNNFCQFCYKIQ